ncbi:MAG: tail fiber domain-containing protein, partial [Candidatus Rokuibacteriota bacterium]
MSVDLVVSNALSATQQAVQDQNGNSSGLYLSTNNQVNVTSSGQVVFGIGGDGIGEWIQNASGGTGQNYGIAFYGNAQEWMRITNAGQVGVGTTAPSATLHVSGSVRFQGLASGPGNTTDLVADTNGNVFLQSSSRRFKENIRELKEDFRRLFGLRPVAFRHKESGTEGIGYVAEEVA